MTEHFECHVTVGWDPSRVKYYKRLAEETGWNASWIDGDPVLGEKRFFYFTRHETSARTVFVAMGKLVYQLTDTLGNVVLRRKVEQIIFDDKTGVGLDA